MNIAVLATKARAAGLDGTNMDAVWAFIVRAVIPEDCDSLEDAGLSLAAVDRAAAEVARRLRATAPEARAARVRAAGQDALARALAAAGHPVAAIEDVDAERIRIRFRSGRAIRMRAPDWGALAAADGLLSQQAAVIVRALGAAGNGA